MTPSCILTNDVWQWCAFAVWTIFYLLLGYATCWYYMRWKTIRVVMVLETEANKISGVATQRAPGSARFSPNEFMRLCGKEHGIRWCIKELTGDKK